MQKADEVKQDEERIIRDEERIIRDQEQLLRDEEKLLRDKKPKFFYSLDETDYESAKPDITGADVRAKLPPDKAGYAIYLEGHGNNPDKQVSDGDSFSLVKGKICFYSVPPATFGLP